MKVAASALTILGMSSLLSAYELPTTGSGALAKEIQDFVDLLPLSQIIDTARTYMAQDKEFQIVMKLFQSKEMKQYISYLEAAPEITHLLKYIQNAGLDIHQLLNKLNESLHIEPVIPLKDSDRKISGGIEGFVRDFAALIPRGELTELYELKMKSSKVFADLVTEVTSANTMRFLSAMYKSKQFFKLAKEAEKSGVDSQSLEHYFLLLVMVKPAL